MCNRGYIWLTTWMSSSRNKVALSLLGIMLLILSAEPLIRKWRKSQSKRRQQRSSIDHSQGAVYCGTSSLGEKVYIKTRQRVMHTQVIGATNAGKTESVILPWAVQDIAQGRGLILIDGKADRSLLNKLYSYAVKLGRKHDFRLFSLSHIEESQQFNPLIGGTSEEISERVFNAFEFQDPYYRSIQFEVFSQIMRCFAEVAETPTFLKLHQAITDPDCLAPWEARIKDHDLKRWLDGFTRLSARERLERTSGLLAALSHFAYGQVSCLFASEHPEITLEKALSESLIVYFQLPVLLSPFLGKATGRLVLQSLQSAIAKRHQQQSELPPFYSVFLDDFSEYLYPGFVSILNKSRSANVGVVFAHQALGDINVLGEAVANSILTNANLKVFMRGNDPDSAEYFAKVVGTSKATKYTERTKRGLWKSQSTGEASAREVEEFMIHPNRFKHGLGVGEAVMVIPHESGTRTLTLRFEKLDDLEPIPIERIPKIPASGLISDLGQKRDSNAKSKGKFQDFQNRDPRKEQT